jgi:hypothetical protein
MYYGREFCGKSETHLEFETIDESSIETIEAQPEEVEIEPENT